MFTMAHHVHQILICVCIYFFNNITFARFTMFAMYTMFTIVIFLCIVNLHPTFVSLNSH